MVIGQNNIKIFCSITIFFDLTVQPCNITCGSERLSFTGSAPCMVRSGKGENYRFEN